MGDKPKAMAALDEYDYSYPLADVSGLSEEEKKDLLIRGMHHSKEFHSDEEFEQWVILFAGRNTCSYSDGHEPTEEERERDRMITAGYERGVWYHNKRFKARKKVHLQPLVDELVRHAAHDPQYDWQYLFALEYAKLRCMRAYFSHSIIADSNGDFGFNRWIDTCIALLQHLWKDGANISEYQIRQMNIRNMRDIVPQSVIDGYLRTLAVGTDDDALPDWLFTDGKYMFARWSVFITE